MMINADGREGDPRRSYAVSAPAYQVASQLYYSYRIIRWELDRSYGSRAPS